MIVVQHVGSNLFFFFFKKKKAKAIGSFIIKMEPVNHFKRNEPCFEGGTGVRQE